MSKIILINDAVDSLIQSKKLPYEIRLVGKKGLKRSNIPKKNYSRVIFGLDIHSDQALYDKALEMGLTQDELLRYLVWSFIY